MAKTDTMSCYMCNSKPKKLSTYNFFAVRKGSEKHKQFEKIGYILPCKNCLKNMCFDANGIVNLNGVHKALELLDIPFIKEEFNKMVEEGNFDIGKYKQRMCINEYKDLLYKDSDDLIQEFKNNNKTQEVKAEDEKKIEKSNNIKEDFDIEKDFKVTKEMYERWGTAFDKSEIMKLEKEYNDLVNEYGDNSKTSKDLYIEYAKNLILIDRAMIEGDHKTRKELIELNSKIMRDANITPSNKNSDMQGITNGVLIKFLEEFQPVSEVHPDFKDVDNIKLYHKTFFVEPILRNAGKSTSPVEDDFKKVESLNGKIF